MEMRGAMMSVAKGGSRESFELRCLSAGPTFEITASGLTKFRTQRQGGRALMLYYLGSVAQIPHGDICM